MKEEFIIVEKVSRARLPTVLTEKSADGWQFVKLFPVGIGKRFDVLLKRPVAR